MRFPKTTELIDFLCFFTLPVFCYHIVSGQRLLLLLVAFLCLIAVRTARVRHLRSIKLACLTFIYILSLSLVGGEFHTLVNFAIFYLIYLLFSSFVIDSNFNYRRERYLVQSGNALALGVILQKYLHEYLGVNVGNILVLPNRVAYTFTWQDSSYLSLYLALLVSVTLFSIYLSTRYKTITLSILFLGIFATSARTGLLMAFVSVLIWALLERRWWEKIIFAVTALLLLSVNLISILEQITGRTEILHAGTRLMVLENALLNIKQKPVFGELFAIERYVEFTGLPIVHNVFGFILVSGGILFLILQLIFLSALLIESNAFSNRQLFVTFFIFLFGLNFLPSPFGAYFIIPLFVLGRLTKVERNVH